MFYNLETITKMRKLCTLIFLIWATLPATAQVGFQISPGKVFFRLLANQPGTQNIRITNPTASEQVVECTFSDWKRDSIAQKVYSKSGTLPNSCSKYLHANPENFVLKPGESRLIEVSMSLPDGEDRQVTNSMLMITQISEKNVDKQGKNLHTGMVFQVQMGVHIYNEPPQLQVKNVDIVDVSSFDRPKAKDSTGPRENVVKALIANIGERISEGSVRFELTNKTTLEEWKSKAQDFNTMPGDKFYVGEILPATLAKGRYNMITILDFGSDQPLKVAESEIEVK